MPGIAYRPLLSRSFTPSSTSNTATNERSTTPDRYFSRSSGGSDKSKKQNPFESVLCALFLQSVWFSSSSPARNAASSLTPINLISFFIFLGTP